MGVPAVMPSMISDVIIITIINNITIFNIITTIIIIPTGITCSFMMRIQLMTVVVSLFVAMRNA